MTPRIGSPSPVLSPGRVFVPADPHRRLECFLVDVFPTGFDLHTQFPLPVDELVAAEVEDHLVLADIKKCQLKSGKFEIELERLHAIPLSRFDDGPVADPETKLRLILEEYINDKSQAEDADSYESRMLLDRTRAALARVSPTTVAAVRAVPRFDEPVSPSPRLALVRELPMSPPPALTNGHVSVPNLAAFSESTTQRAEIFQPEETAPSVPADLPASESNVAIEAVDIEAAEFEAVPASLAAPAEITPAPIEPESAPTREPLHWKFEFAENLPEPTAQPVTPTAGWLYHFVPAPRAPRAPALRDIAKDTIERL